MIYVTRGPVGLRSAVVPRDEQAASLGARARATGERRWEMPRLVSRHRAGGMAAVLVCLIGASMVAEAGAQEPPRTYDQALVDRWMTELSNWGRWGKDDELGTLNLITPEKRRQAMALARAGGSILGLALDGATAVDEIELSGVTVTIDLTDARAPRALAAVRAALREAIPKLIFTVSRRVPH